MKIQGSCNPSEEDFVTHCLHKLSIHQTIHSLVMQHSIYRHSCLDFFSKLTNGQICSKRQSLKMLL